MDFHGWRQQPGRPREPDQSKAEFLELVAELSAREESFGVTFNEWRGPLHLKGYGARKSNLAYIVIPSTGGGVKLTGIAAKNVNLSAIRATADLECVFADQLILSDCRDVVLKDCWIGTLTLSGGAAATTLHVSGGGILNIACAPPDGDRPFTGAVHLDDGVYLPRRPGIRLKNSQPYRNMRAHMLRLENTPMANLFHAREHAVDRSQEQLGVTRAVSWCYELFSDYGSSPGRALGWFVGLYLLSTGLLFASDGATIVPAGVAAGWEEWLVGPDLPARFLRAAVLAGQSTLNPLGIFGRRGLLVAAHPVIAFWLLVHGLLSAVLAALFILALRRRFKIA